MMTLKDLENLREMEKRFSPAQVDYMRAEALEQVAAKSAKYTATHAAATQLKEERFQALKEWAAGVLKSHSPERYEQIRVCFEKPIYSAELRKKFVDILLTLDPGVGHEAKG